jgi:hypothetical protein
VDWFIWFPILLIVGLGTASLIALLVETRTKMHEILDDEAWSNVVPLPNVTLTRTVQHDRRVDSEG